ncbi:MAG TPA: redoxin family protein [Candidatus Acidoferrales bacterium]|nr:redoxin family protein [Candidatus Acidoferrales bacterium]
MEIEKGKVHAPELGAIWLNSEPIELRKLRGRAVLVDFWDYTCVNCLRTLPYVVEWDRRYSTKGLSVIGVHTPEFSFAANEKFVRAAVEKFGIKYPVVLDNGYAIWHAYANRYWPAKYLIDKEGYIRFFHFGEGEYGATEEAIQVLVREVSPRSELPPVMEPVRDTDRPGAVCYRTSPELYLGNKRGKAGNPSGFLHENEDQAGEYTLPEKIDADKFYLSGAWISREECARSAPNGTTPSSVVLYYSGKEVNLVMAPDGEPQEVELLHTGEPLSDGELGEDAVRDKDGRTIVRVDSPRMYNLVQNPGMKQRLLQLVARKPGLECYAFTFTTCTAQDDPPW